MAADLELAQGGTWNCYDVLGEVDIAMRESILPEHQYFVLGGIASGAIEDPASVLDVASSTVVAAPDSGKSLLRENGSKRDIDILVNAILSPEDADRINANVREAIGDRMLVSVFGIEAHSEQRTPLFDFHKMALSSRTIDQQGILRYELFPLIQEVQPESYAPWQLELPSGARLQVLHPAGHVLAYSMRSISGVRHKDQEKYDAMSARVIPEFAEEINDGVFKEWQQFADGITALLAVGRRAQVSVHSAARPADQSFFRTKGKLLGFAERFDKVVDYFQQDDKQAGILKGFVGNK